MSAHPSGPPHAPLCAGDLMTTQVVTVPADAPIGTVAKTLLDHRISAAPVVNADGMPIGMVSEGDLIGRDESQRVSRADWWLALLAGRRSAEPVPEDAAKKRTAADVMTAPVVTVEETTPADAIARTLLTQHVKRVPVVRDGRIVGIVSRADLLCVLAAGLPQAAPAEAKHHSFLQDMFGEYRRPDWEVIHVNKPDLSGAAATEHVSADDFRHLVADFHNRQAERHDEAKQRVAEERQRRVKAMIDAHLTDEDWREMLHRARAAAESGEEEIELLQFPSELCTDGGRMIDVAEPGWAATLRGEPAELYLRWERELKPRGFRLSARIVNYPDGKPGDIGLSLLWAGETA